MDLTFDAEGMQGAIAYRRRLAREDRVLVLTDAALFAAIQVAKHSESAGYLIIIIQPSFGKQLAEAVSLINLETTTLVKLGASVIQFHPQPFISASSANYRLLCLAFL